VPTATAQPQPTAASGPALASSAEQILGTWLGIGAAGMYRKFMPDGTFWAATQDWKLAKNPDVVCTYEFEGTTLRIVEVKVVGVTSCGTAKEALCQVQLLPNGNIRFVPLIDACTGRRESMSLEHKPVP